MSSTRNNTPTDLQVSFYDPFTSITNDSCEIPESATSGPALEDAIDDWVGIADFLGLVSDAHQKLEDFDTTWITNTGDDPGLNTLSLNDPASYQTAVVLQPNNPPSSTEHSTIGTSLSPDIGTSTRTSPSVDTTPPRDVTGSSMNTIQCTWPSCKKSFRTMTEYK